MIQEITSRMVVWCLVEASSLLGLLGTNWWVFTEITLCYMVDCSCPLIHPFGMWVSLSRAAYIWVDQSSPAFSFYIVISRLLRSCEIAKLLHAGQKFHHRFLDQHKSPHKQLQHEWQQKSLLRGQRVRIFHSNYYFFLSEPWMWF